MVKTTNNGQPRGIVVSSHPFFGSLIFSWIMRTDGVAAAAGGARHTVGTYSTGGISFDVPRQR